MSALLLDTHVFIWSLTDDPRLASAGRSLLEDTANEVAVSILALWEIALKRGADRMPVSVEDAIAALPVFQYRLVHLMPAHVRGFAALPQRADHRDPFDRMLVAQARVEGLTLMTEDAKLRRYGVPTIGCA